MARNYYRQRHGEHKASVSMREDCHLAVKAFIERNADKAFSLSGAIHHLLRTHPEINLPPIQ
jgi:hypothetical protein